MNTKAQKKKDLKTGEDQVRCTDTTPPREPQLTRRSPRHIRCKQNVKKVDDERCWDKEPRREPKDGQPVTRKGRNFTEEEPNSVRACQ